MLRLLEELPDLKDPEVKNATVKIQSSFRGFQARKKVKQVRAYDIAMAVIRIQSAYRAYKARKKVAMFKDLPNLKHPGGSRGVCVQRKNKCRPGYLRCDKLRR